MNSDQPALLQKYMKLRHHKVGLRRTVAQDNGAPGGAFTCPSWISSRSASLTAGWSRGVSRNKYVNPTTQTTPSSPSKTKAPRQPGRPNCVTGYVNATMRTGARAPPQRPKVQINPWARPRSAKGNQLRVARAMFG